MLILTRKEINMSHKVIFTIDNYLHPFTEVIEQDDVNLTNKQIKQILNQRLREFNIQLNVDKIISVITE